MHVCLYFEGLKQRIQLNDKTIHKLEIQLQTLKNQAGNTIQQKQLYLDKAHTTIVQMERIIEKSEEKDAIKKWQKLSSKGKNIRCIDQFKLNHDLSFIEIEIITLRGRRVYINKTVQQQRFRLMGAVQEGIDVGVLYSAWFTTVYKYHIVLLQNAVEATFMNECTYA